MPVHRETFPVIDLVASLFVAEALVDPQSLDFDQKIAPLFAEPLSSSVRSANGIGNSRLTGHWRGKLLCDLLYASVSGALDLLADILGQVRDIKRIRIRGPRPGLTNSALAPAVRRASPDLDDLGNGHRRAWTYHRFRFHAIPQGEACSRLERERV